MSDLKPCPFCGCKEVNIEAAGDCGDLFSVMCKCGVESDYAECREDAIGQWNKRTTDRLEQENAELREAFVKLKSMAIREREFRLEDCEEISEPEMRESLEMFGAKIDELLNK